jgi:hypothetical protein
MRIPKPDLYPVLSLFNQRQIRHAAIVFAISFVVGTSQVSAQPPTHANKQGPRASVSAATVCAIDGSDFTVEIRVYDKTSGEAIARVAAWSIDALAKTGQGNWSNETVFGSASEGVLSLPVPTTIGPERFSLCVLDGSGLFYVINPIIAEAKGLNAVAATTYGRLNEATWVIEDQRTIMNMCSDDLMTLDVVEPSGIKLDAEAIAGIQAACAVLPPPTP